MHWIKKFFLDDAPVLGDERVRTGFLWLPKAVRDETRWLVQASWRERYVWTGHGARERTGWRAVEWIDEGDARATHAEPSATSTQPKGRTPASSGARSVRGVVIGAPVECVLVEAMLRGGPYDGSRREMHPDARRVQLCTKMDSGQMQVAEYAFAGREEGRLVLEHVGTWVRNADDGR